MDYRNLKESKTPYNEKSASHYLRDASLIYKYAYAFFFLLIKSTIIGDATNIEE
jgi:hypothetical protein